MSTEAEGLLDRGLANGYAKRADTQRGLDGPFSTKRIVYTEPDPQPHGKFYSDEWLRAFQGGGHELAWSTGDNSGAIRMYAGGVVDDHIIIDSLGISPEQILAQHEQFVSSAVGVTRGKENYTGTDGEWDYKYYVLAQLNNQGIDLTVALETVEYRGELVFAHGFLSNPVIIE